MKTIYSNATVMWTEREIEERDALVKQCYQLVREAWTGLNGAVQFQRVETPILTPADFLKGHIEAKFDLLQCDRGYLRPETTAGTYEAFNLLYPNQQQRLKRLPYCVWQLGKSFRDEQKPETMRASKLRLVEFHQMEFQLFTGATTKAPYLDVALDALTTRFGGVGVEVPEKDLAHYAARAIDWEIDGLEVGGLHIRKDWTDGIVFEVALGIDRLVAKITTKDNK